MSKKENYSSHKSADMTTTVNYSKIKFASKPVSTKESLKDIKPINWSETVANGEKKVVISKTKI